MKKIVYIFMFIITASMLSGCGLVEDVFKAGLYFALFIVLIIGLLVWLLRITITQLSKHYTWQPLEINDLFVYRYCNCL